MITIRDYGTGNLAAVAQFSLRGRLLQMFAPGECIEKKWSMCRTFLRVLAFGISRILDLFFKEPTVSLHTIHAVKVSASYSTQGIN